MRPEQHAERDPLSKQLTDEGSAKRTSWKRTLMKAGNRRKSWNVSQEMFVKRSICRRQTRMTFEEHEDRWLDWTAGTKPETRENKLVVWLELPLCRNQQRGRKEDRRGLGRSCDTRHVLLNDKDNPSVPRSAPGSGRGVMVAWVVASMASLVGWRGWLYRRRPFMRGHIPLFFAVREKSPRTDNRALRVVPALLAPQVNRRKAGGARCGGS